MRVVKIYFSPTGNTKKIVDAVASGMAGDGVKGVGVGIGDVKGREEYIDYDVTLPQKRKEFAY